MRVPDLLAHGVESLRADRRQTLLAVIGILCGVATVVAALAIGEGAKREALGDVDALGIDNVIVDCPSMRLTTADARAIGRSIAGIAAVAPVRSGRLPVETAARAMPVLTIGVTSEWPLTTHVRIARGRWFSDADVAAHRRVAVAGRALSDRLFPGADPVGARVRVDGDWFVVVGVLAAPAAAEHIFVPFGALDRRLAPADGVDHVSRLVASVERGADVTVRAAHIDRLLRRSQPADAFHLIVPRELLDARLKARRALDALLLAIGTLVLAISGLGIMNVMLAGVARRVTEIGVRRAVGARRADVIGQFAGEAIALCTAGGLAGLPVGAVGTAIVGRLAGWPTAMSAFGLGSALAMAVASGLVFGIYPAVVAARWTPCEALRHE